MQKRQGRGVTTQRTIETIILLSTKGRTLWELSHKFNVSTKTVRRDIATLEALNIPVYIEQVYDEDPTKEKDSTLTNKYRVDKHWLRPFI